MPAIEMSPHLNSKQTINLLRYELAGITIEEVHNLCNHIKKFDIKHPTDQQVDLLNEFMSFCTSCENLNQDTFNNHFRGVIQTFEHNVFFHYQLDENMVSLNVPISIKPKGQFCYIKTGITLIYPFKSKLNGFDMHIGLYTVRNELGKIILPSLPARGNLYYTVSYRSDLEEFDLNRLID